MTINTSENQLRQEARALFHKGGLNCAEATLRLLIERGSLDADISMQKMMTGFGGGMQKGLVCGAVTAAVAALSFKTGRISPEESREPSAQSVAAFMDEFQNLHGDWLCSELTKPYAAKSLDMYEHCLDYVSSAVELVERLLVEKP